MKKFYLILAVCIGLSACKKTDYIVPQDFPSDTSVEGFQFPEDQDKIYDWLANEDEDSIASHAWGLWAGLTKKVDQSYKGQDLYVFETWNGVSELSDLSSLGNRSGGCRVARSSRNKLNRPKQFSHAGLLASELNKDYSILETVVYSPPAACFSTSNLIFNKSVLDSLRVKGGIGKIPSFPLTSIAAKPTYYVTKSNTGLVRLPAWSTTPDPAKTFPHSQWNNWVYVDLDDRQTPGKQLIPVNVEDPSPEQIAAATCNRSDFINFSLDSDTADYLNNRQDRDTNPDHRFKSGSVALLVAMHVTSKEIENWTWQTYFWVPNPADPGAPSSWEIASLRPDIITGAAAHYAAAVAYAMIYPNQPVTGGLTTSDTRPIIAYNPYLEAGFGPGVFSRPNDWQPDFKYGVQTNCASCHALAAHGKDLGYTTDQYIDMRDPLFNDTVQLDFAWSIAGNLNTKN